MKLVLHAAASQYINGVLLRYHTSVDNRLDWENKDFKNSEEYNVRCNFKCCKNHAVSSCLKIKVVAQRFNFEMQKVTAEQLECCKWHYVNRGMTGSSQLSPLPVGTHFLQRWTIIVRGTEVNRKAASRQLAAIIASARITIRNGVRWCESQKCGA